MTDGWRNNDSGESLGLNACRKIMFGLLLGLKYINDEQLRGF